MFLSAVVLALKAIRRNKLRATLTVLGILIGVMAVVVVAALGQGASQSVGKQISALGNNAMIVFPKSTKRSGATGMAGTTGRLTVGDGKAIVREASAVKAWAANVRARVQALAGGENVSVNVIGTNRAYFEVRDWNVEQGSPWDENMGRSKAKVCVIGTTTRNDLFGDGDAIGRSIRIGRASFKVLGVLASKGQSPLGGNQDEVIIMPLGTYHSHVRWEPPGTAGALLLSATSDEKTELAVRQATSILRQRHHIAEDAEADFKIRTQKEFQKSQEQILGALSLLLMSVAGVSLLVGGIGVMNIMLVSVAERTREIGIRMAIGAQEGDILIQFLVEAVVLSLVGGAAGLLMSVLLLKALSGLVPWPLPISPRAVLIAMAVSGGIGVVFGFFPARRAAKLDPIVALRRE